MLAWEVRAMRVVLAVLVLLVADAAGAWCWQEQRCVAGRGCWAEQVCDYGSRRGNYAAPVPVLPDISGQISGMLWGTRGRCREVRICEYGRCRYAQVCE